MKNKKLLIVLITLTIVFAIIVAFCGYFAQNYTVVTVRCVIMEGGSLFMVYQDRLVCLHGESNDPLTTGDKIFVIMSSAIAESYPEQAYARFISKLEDGSIDDINLDEEYIRRMEEMGYIIK